MENTNSLRVITSSSNCEVIVDFYSSFTDRRFARDEQLDM